ncbi:MAG: molybdenum cofactor biosynthesis protein MoaE [Actinomycetes bacterium]
MSAMPDPVQTRAVVVRAVVCEEPISSAQHAALVRGNDRGAVVTFSGVVRDHDHGRAVTDLQYSAHPSAGEVLAGIVAEAADRFGVGAIAVSHRIGSLQIGQEAFVVAVASAHRTAAFETCAWLVDEVKSRVPIWKRQTFDDGTHEWVNCP